VAASGAVFINRKSKTHALAAMAKAGEKMKRRGVSHSSAAFQRVVRACWPSAHLLLPVLLI
jgi:hypothetical protein